MFKFVRKPGLIKFFVFHIDFLFTPLYFHSVTVAVGYFSGSILIFGLLIAFLLCIVAIMDQAASGIGGLEVIR